MNNQAAKNDGGSGEMGGQVVTTAPSEIIRIADEIPIPEETVKTITSITDGVIWAVDPDTTRFFFVDSTYENLLGRDPHQLHESAFNFIKTIRPTDRTKFVDSIEKTANGSETSTRIYVNDTVDYTTPVRTMMTPVQDDNGDVVAIIGHMKECEESQVDYAAEINNILHQSPNEVLVLTEGLDIAYVTPSSMKLLSKGTRTNWEEISFANTNLKEFVHEDDWEDVQKQLQQIVNIPAYETSIACRVRQQDNAEGERWIRIHASDQTENEFINGVLLFIRDITEQKSREKEFQLYKKAIDNAGHSIFWTDTEGNIEYVNSAFEELTGYNRQEALGETPSILKSGEQDDAYYRELWETVQSGEVFRGEVINKNSDGNLYRVYQTITPIRDETGEITNYVAINDNITEEYEQEQRYERLIENVPGIVYQSEIDEEWPLTVARGNIDTIIGYSSQELMNTVNWSEDILHEDDRESVTEESMRQLDNKGRFEVTYRIRTKDDEVRWMWERGQKISEGLIEGFITDITERREKRQELRRRADVFENVENIAAIGAWEYSVEEHELWWSDQTRVIHRSPRDFTPTPEEAFDCFSGRHKIVCEEAFKEVVETGDSFEEVLQLEVFDGSDRWVRVRGEPQFDPEGDVNMIRGTVQDITDEREYKKQLEEVNTGMEELFRMDTNTQIAHSVMDTIVETLGVNHVAVCFYNEDHAELQPVTMSEAFSEDIGESMFKYGPGDNVIWQSYLQEKPISEKATDSECELSTVVSTPIEAEFAVPLGGYGVIFLATRNQAGFKESIQTLVGILSSTVTKALERADQRHTLISQNQELEKQKTQLHQAKQLNREIRSITREIIHSETAEEVDDTICEAVTNLSGIDHAWIGKPNDAGDALNVMAETGDESVATNFDRQIHDETTLPAVTACETGEVQVHDNIAHDVQGELWRATVLEENYVSSISIPVMSEGIVNGVITLYSMEHKYFEDIITDVLLDIAEFTGYVYNVVEQRGALVSNNSGTLVFRISEPEDVFSEVASVLDKEITVNHIAPAARDSQLVYLSTGTPRQKETIEDVFERHPDVRDVSVVSETDELVFEVETTGECIPRRIAKLGGQFQHATVRKGSTDVTVVIGDVSETACYSARVTDAVDKDLSLRGKTTDTNGSASYQVVMRDHLSQTQEQVLRTAYHNGYFDKSRKRTGSAIAESLGIAQPTFSLRLRTAQRNLLNALYSSEETVTT